MSPRERKSGTKDAEANLSSLSSEGARRFLASALASDPRTGILRLHGQPCVIVRPKVLVNIQKQLEQTMGGSAKGIMYLAGERSSRDGVVPVHAIPGNDGASLTLEGARRMIDAFSVLGWGHAEVVMFDAEHDRLVLRIVNSPMALGYGPSSKPVCHFLAGWAAGMGEALVGRELLCEEVACKAQGRGYCEFELRPMHAP
jgi:predicted hydrocarbon binding protein